MHVCYSGFLHLQHFIASAGANGYSAGPCKIIAMQSSRLLTELSMHAAVWSMLIQQHEMHENSLHTSSLTELPDAWLVQGSLA